jgi:hypothetical protein
MRSRQKRNYHRKYHGLYEKDEEQSPNPKKTRNEKRAPRNLTKFVSEFEDFEDLDDVLNYLTPFCDPYHNFFS